MEIRVKARKMGELVRMRELEDAIYADVGAAQDVLDRIDVCAIAPPEMVREVARRAKGLREALERVELYTYSAASDKPSSGSINSS